VSPWDDEGCFLEDVLGDTADGNETAFISSPPSKFPTKEPHVIVRMTNHNGESFENGYDSDGELPFFNPVADMGEDPSSYNEKAVEINTPLQDPPNIPQPSVGIFMFQLYTFLYPLGFRGSRCDSSS